MSAKRRLTVKTLALAAMLVALIGVWSVYNHQLQQTLGNRLLLNSANPREEFFGELATQSEDPVGFLQRSWATGKVTHRQLVAAFLKDSAYTNASWLDRADSLLLACALDADASVRELALATLEAQKSPHLFEAARAQLSDLDPLVRLLGLGYLRKSDPRQAVPVLMPLLDDPDLRVVAAAEVGLMRWSGEDYGVRVRLTIPGHEEGGPGQLEPSKAETIRLGAERRREWWRLHRDEYSSSAPTPSGPSLTTRVESARPAAADFELTDLGGKQVRLSDFRGKVVLLNFWATWCPACLTEIPVLSQLHNKWSRQLAVVGVALDGIPDEHGHTPGEETEASAHEKHPSLEPVLAKVQSAAKARRINYPVLLDSKNAVGGQYNGGELPTTVLIDAEGRVRRRFIGPRNLEVFEAMIAEAAKPVTSGQRPLAPAAN